MGRLFENPLLLILLLVLAIPVAVIVAVVVPLARRGARVPPLAALPASPPTAADPGWYADPDGAGRRHWDGRTCTDHSG